MNYWAAYNTYQLKSCNAIHSVADAKGERYAVRFNLVYLHTYVFTL